MYEPVAIKPLLRSKILHDFVYNSYFKKKNFFSMEMNIYAINIKTTVTWHHDYYVCQGYKKSKN